MPTKYIHPTFFGFQAGPYGFVKYGTGIGPRLGWECHRCGPQAVPPEQLFPHCERCGAILVRWEDYLYLEAHGGRGSGKSASGAFRAANYMVTWPKSFGTILAPTFDMMRQATLPALLNVFDTYGLEPNTHYEFNKTENRITFLFNGATAILRTTEHAENVRGQDGCWFWMDEGRNSPLTAFTNAQATLRKPGYPHQGWVTTTPVGKMHWTYQVFHPEDGDDPPTLGEPQTDSLGDQVTFLMDELPNGRLQRRFYTVKKYGSALNVRYVPYPAKTRENPHGGEDHYRQLVSTYGENSLLARQELDGDFVLMEGLAYPGWSPDHHLVPRALWPVQRHNRVLAGVDFGFRNPSAIVVEGLDGEGRRYILDEFYQTEMSEPQLVRVCQSLQKKWDIQYFMCDTEDPRWIRALRSAGLPALNARKRVGSARDLSSGIGLCTWALANTLSDGSPAFFVNPACVNFRKEIENYVLDPGRDGQNLPERPRKHMDHLMDAWRYSEMGIARFWDRPQEVMQGRRIKVQGRA